MVDHSLARGLADFILDDMAFAAASCLAAAQSMRGCPIYKRSDVRHLFGDLRSLGERCCLTQICAQHPKWKWGAYGAFVPVVQTKSKGGSNRDVSFVLLSAYARAGEFLRMRSRTPVLIIKEHAVERVLQRVPVKGMAAARDELHDAMLVSRPCLATALACGFQQILVPTKSGALVCSVDPDNRCLVAKTWIPSHNMSRRHSVVLEDIQALCKELGGETALAALLVEFVIEESSHVHVDNLASIEALQRHRWLNEPYETRPDREGEVWRKARAQESDVLSALGRRNSPPLDSGIATR